MRRAVALWLRRSSVSSAFPAMVGIALASAWSRSGWQYEWDWALSWTAGATILLGPAVAGLVAHDRARRHAPTLTLIERTAPRGPLASLSAPIAAFGLGTAAWLTAAGVVLVRVSRNGPVGRPSLAIFLEVAVVVLAAAFLGAAVGSWVRTRAAGPLAALAVYALFILAPRVNLGGVMEAGGTLGTLVGLKTSPQWLAGHLVVHLTIVVAAALAILARSTVSRTARVTALVGAVAILVAGAVTFGLSNEDGPYRPVATETLCLGRSPVVCGPDGAEPILTIARNGMHRAYVELADSGLPLQDRYVMARGLGDERFPPDAGELSVDPSTFQRGADSRDDIVMTLSTPTLCAAYFDDFPPRRLMAAQAQVMRWIDRRLDGAVDGPAPAQIRSRYQLLLSCAPHQQALR